MITGLNAVDRDHKAGLLAAVAEEPSQLIGVHDCGVGHWPIYGARPDTAEAECVHLMLTANMICIVIVLRTGAARML